MDGIVLKLQQEALNKDADVESLLRKAYVIARKLRLKDFGEWIKLEQDGYLDKAKVPAYRKMGGTLHAYNPANGKWIPVAIAGRGRDKFFKLPIREAISSLSDLYMTAKDNVSFSVNGTMTDMLNKTSPFETIYVFIVPKSQLYQILSTVQNKILDRALLLEENGIEGKNFSFTDIEIRKAEQTSIINNYINNFYANVENIDLQQGTVK